MASYLEAVVQSKRLSELIFISWEEQCYVVTLII
jgi:hypothetical protein